MLRIPQDLGAIMRANSIERSEDAPPVIKLFTPDGNATWLLSEIDEDEIMFGLCDLGMGCPELGYVYLGELQTVRGRLGLPIERDLHWTATAPMSAYADAARAAGRIVDTLPTSRPTFPVQSEPTDAQQADKARAAGWGVDYPKPL